MAAVSAPESVAGHAPPAALERPDFQIVPRAGLPFVGVVLVLLIAGVASNKLWPLEFLHVVGGAAWTIIDLFLGFVLGPIIGKLSIPARVEFTTRLMPKMVLIMPTVVTVTGLLRELLIACTEPDLTASEERRIRAVLNDRLRRAHVRPLTLPTATDPRLARACQVVTDDLREPRTVTWLARRAGTRAAASPSTIR